MLIDVDYILTMGWSLQTQRAQGTENPVIESPRSKTYIGALVSSDIYMDNFVTKLGY